MANLKSEATSAWDPEMIPKLDMKDEEQFYRDEVPIGGLEAFEDLPPVHGDAAFGACRHSVTDDNDCVDCRTSACSGGNDCECPSVISGRRRQLEVA